MVHLVSPHGSDQLMPLRVEKTHLDQSCEFAHQLHLGSKEFGDLLMLGIGAFTPLLGFMNQEDWKGVCQSMMLLNGLFWPIPITLSCDSQRASSFKIGDKIGLFSPQGELSGILYLEDKYTPDKNFECRSIFGTCDDHHPGVIQVMSQGDVYLGGKVDVLTDGPFKTDFSSVYLTPKVVREEFKSRGWSKVAAFQTRNPMHRSHEYLTKIALEVCDGVLIHSILGQLKPGDIPAHIRIEAITQLIENYYVSNTILQAGYPMDMRYAGPKEALLHALFRQNFGCAYLIVGRDHAGVGDYYGAFDAQNIFDHIPKGALEIKPLKLDWTFWCEHCDGMSSLRTCPHDPKQRLLLSGTKLRNLLSAGDVVPDHFTRKEVLAVLRAYYRKQNA